MNSRLILIFSILITLIGAFGVISQVVEMRSATNDIPKNVEQRSFVKVAKLNENVTKGDDIDLIDITFDEIPENDSVGLIAIENVPGIEKGTIFKHRINRGGYIKNTDIISPKEKGYVEYVVTEGNIAYELLVKKDSIKGLGVNNNDVIDILALYGIDNNEIHRVGHKTPQTIAIKSVLLGVKLIKIDRAFDENELILTLELTKAEASELSIASQIAILEVHKSTGNYTSIDIDVDAGDVFEEYHTIKEYRGNEMQIK